MISESASRLLRVEAVTGTRSRPGAGETLAHTRVAVKTTSLAASLLLFSLLFLFSPSRTLQVFLQQRLTCYS